MLVDDEDLAVAHDVVLVPVEELLGLDGVVEESDQGGVLRLVEVVHPEVVLHPLDAGGEHTHGALLLVDLVVLASRRRSEIVANSLYHLLTSPVAGPEMMSGVRAHR